jgi:PKD repeat protein
VEWDFGDGSPPALSGLASEFRHTYSAAGSYALKLKIKDARGIENTISGSIAVAASAASGSLEADALFAGTYYDYVDNGAAGKCYYKTAGSPVGVRTQSPKRPIAWKTANGRSRPLRVQA